MPSTSSSGDFLRCHCGCYQMNHRPTTDGGCRNCGCAGFRLDLSTTAKDTLPRGGAEGSEDRGPMCHCGHVANDHDSHGLAGDTCHGCDCKALRTGVHVHKWGTWDCIGLDRNEVWTRRCPCGTSQSRSERPSEPELCGDSHLGITEDPCYRPSGHPGMHESERRVWSNLEDERPQVRVCGICEGPHGTEDCKRLEEPEEDPYKGLAGNCGTCGATGTDAEPEEETAPVPPWAIRDGIWRRIESEIYEWRERTALWGESDGITQSLADLARRAVEPADIPRRPPYAVAYGVEGGAQYEVAVSGDATVVAEDGALHILHPKRPVLAITRVQPMNMEENND